MHFCIYLQKFIYFILIKNLYSMNIKVIKAYHGDCIFISIPYCSTKKANILIDGGPKQTYFNLRSRPSQKGELQLLIEQLKCENEHIDLLILTHVDDDHIGGLLAWFTDDFPDSEFIKEVWINDEISISLDTDLNNTSENAASLLTILRDKGFNLRNNIVVGMKDVEFLWGKIKILAPTEKNHNVIAAEIKVNLNNTGSNKYENTIKNSLMSPWIKNAISPENKASIAFLLETNECEQILLLGDACIDTIMKSLLEFGYTKSNPLRCKAVKLSHHGSKNNFTPEFTDVVQADSYIVSTNGKTHGFPNKEVIAWLIDRTNSQILFNYYEIIDDIFTIEDWIDYPSINERVREA